MANMRRSRALHRSWVQVPTSAKAFQRYVQEMNTSDDQAYVAIRTDTREMVGVVELQDISKMSDTEIDSYARQIWQKLVKPKKGSDDGNSKR